MHLFALLPGELDFNGLLGTVAKDIFQLFLTGNHGAAFRMLPVECPVCHKPALKKQITEAGFVLKGTGWYQTDFKNEGSKPSSSGSHTAGCSCKACSANSKN